jgi:ComEC/Rec2-related protein
MRINFKRIFNPPNIFLFFVSFLIIWNSLLSISQLPKTEQNQVTQELSIRVTGQRNSMFGFLYSVNNQNSLWVLESDKILKIGYEYKIVGQKSQFEFSEDSLYNLGLGYLGKIKLLEIVSSNQNCDIVCQSYSSGVKINRFVETQFLSQSCLTWVSVIDFLAPNIACQDVSALAIGLTTGGTNNFSKEIKDNFKILGLTHLVAVSGFQVGLLVSLVEVISSKLPIKRSYRFWLILILVSLMILIVGPQPPVLRSSLSLLLSIFVLIFLGRRLETWRALIYSGLIMLLFNPLYIISVSFQLSFLATLGLLISSGIENEGYKFWQNIKILFTATISSFLFTLPIIINLSGKVSLMAILSNILIIPFIPIISILNILSLIPIIGQLFGFISLSTQSLILFFIKDFAKIENFLVLSPFSRFELFIYYTCLILIFFFFKNMVTKFDQRDYK